ncbi:MAG: hypothetical protein Q4G24_02990 [Paracoccus sp. (in: a-proteobacteria)]|uniref:hypothetical protein n=1 Tax=Paracoccus sp. TaxID=267 RepID=UPI0026E07DF8|nr:hypothetical protein [Paracoccus sp. (in: a-proteobacteria)]MDO5620416.1 hypothetical protein [Paracoccus sp. (in: a-proteobacteria)]
MMRLVFDPALSWWLMAAVGGLGLLVAGFALWCGLRGWPWRGLALVLLGAALAGPGLESTDRSPLSDIVILLDDRSASQQISDRPAQLDAALAGLSEQIQALPGVDLRRVTVGDDPDGTLLGQALIRAIAAEPAERLAGVIALTDGRLHDPASLPADLPAPVHTLLTGQPQDWDRRLVVVEAPGFGLIGQPVPLRLRVEDQGAVPVAVAGQPARLRISRDGGADQVIDLPPGIDLDLPVAVEHGGANIVSLSIDAPEATPRQLTDRNDSAVLTIQGVRDRLRVLLVSGQPHAGERTWRNLLKSDPAVDLIHFTILRSPDKGDGAAPNEMALIAFPTEELFMNRIQDFDLIIFDRYRVQGILPVEYFDNIRRYVQEGGAILVAAGPEMAGVQSLNLSPLGTILPARPTGRVVDAPFTPELTDAGRRHPVTANLPGATAEGVPEWGRWLRRQSVIPDPAAQVVMAAEGEPLLILNRVGKGRVALLASDQVWLWDRGFEGGGPQLELLRRIAHWSMQEPDLEEESLSASASGLVVSVIRQSLSGTVGAVTITGPDTDTSLTLNETAPGLFTGQWTAPAPGLYRLSEGGLSRLVALGPLAPREFQQTVADGAALEPLAQASGGAVLNLSDGTPQIRRVAMGRPAQGQGVSGAWIGLRERGAQAVGAVSRRPLLPEWGWLALIAGAALAGWLAEGRRRG